MRGSKATNYSADDIAISQFAMAIALPVRIFIIRTIIEQDNLAAKSDFDNTLFNPETVYKHISQLKSAGILKSRLEKGHITYSINKELFNLMSEKFSSFFEDMRAISATQPATTTPAPPENPAEPEISFGEYLKTQRLAFNLTQEEFAKRLAIERAQLSKIETGKAILLPDKLPLLSAVIYEDLQAIKKIYYSDRLADLIQEGALDEDTINMAKLKAGK